MISGKDSALESASPLLQKAQAAGLSIPIDLERLAIARGCKYYDRDFAEQSKQLSDVPISNGELAIMLISPALNPSAREIRLSAALMGSPGLDAGELAALAIQEKCAPVVKHIAQAGVAYEPDNSFWSELLQRLPEENTNAPNLPHPTRFIEMTGIDRGKVGIITRWIRPREPLAA